MKTLFLLSLGLMLSLTSCIYKMDIEQGNAVVEQKLAQLEVGMSKKQVKFLLGNPTIKDVYHANKWHYLRSLKHDNGNELDQKTMVLDFENDTLIRINGSL